MLAQPPPESEKSSGVFFAPNDAEAKQKSLSTLGYNPENVPVKDTWRYLNPMHCMSVHSKGRTTVQG